MTLAEIKEALDKNIEVYYKNQNYVITRSGDKYFIMCLDGHDYTTGLTLDDGITMNGKDEDFFIIEGTEDVIDQLVKNDIRIIFENGAHEDYEFLANVLTGEGFTQYNKMTAAELHTEYMEMKSNKKENNP